MTIDQAFSRRAGFQAYLVAAFSLGYAIAYLGFVRRDPGDQVAAAVASAFLAAGGLSATIAIVAASARVGGDARWWLTAFGTGYALLSVAHGTTDAIAQIQSLALPPISSTDPRGLATFGLAGLWAFTLGLEIRAGNSALPGGLGWLAILTGLDLMVLFAATVAGAQNLVAASGALASVLLVPVLWIWIGRALRR